MRTFIFRPIFATILVLGSVACNSNPSVQTSTPSMSGLAAQQQTGSAIQSQSKPNSPASDNSNDNLVSASDLIWPKNRNDFGQLLEPRGNFILHGAGQGSIDEYQNYTKALKHNEHPVLYTTEYVTLQEDNFVNWTKTLKDSLEQMDKLGGFTVPQVTILFADIMDGKHHYEDKIANGQLDDKIMGLAAALASLKRPVFLRVGDEFNGEWMGLDPKLFQAAFTRIHTLLRVKSFLTEVAFVWNVSVDTTHVNYMDYYPGDDVVDWWGINLFAQDTIEGPVAEKFVTDAASHGKPVMIGESTPRFISVTDPSVWSSWFVPCFDFIRSHANVKAFCYISTNWAGYQGGAAVFNTWGDSRIEMGVNPISEPNGKTVLQMYQDEMEEPFYMNRKSELETRWFLGLPPTAPPVPLPPPPIMKIN